MSTLDDPSNPSPQSLPPSYASSQPDMTAFNNLLRRHELPQIVAQQLLDVLAHREIVLLCDDSSSMMNLVIEEGNDPFASNNTTRWQLLKKIAASIIDFVSSVSHHGLDLYFLKRETVRNVTSVQGLQAVFQTPPDEMGTPLISALRRIFDEKRGHAGLLIIVITDGEPNDGTRDDLRRCLMQKPSDCHVSFAEATDQEDDMQYLDQLKGTIPLFDNTDIYRLECQRVKNLQGQQFKFDWTDYVIKILLATFIPQYWNVDQRRLAGSKSSSTMLYQGQGGGGNQPYYGAPQVYQASAPQVYQARAVQVGQPVMVASPVAMMQSPIAPMQQYPQQTSVIVNNAPPGRSAVCCTIM